MANQRGISITVKAFLPFGKTIDEQLAALQVVKSANDSGNYIDLFKATGIVIDEVKAEEKTRRVEAATAPATTAPATAPADSTATTAPATTEDASGLKAALDAVPPVGDIDATATAATTDATAPAADAAPVEDIPAGADEHTEADIPAFLKSSATAG